MAIQDTLKKFGTSAVKAGGKGLVKGAGFVGGAALGGASMIAASVSQSIGATPYLVGAAALGGAGAAGWKKLGGGVMSNQNTISDKNLSDDSKPSEVEDGEVSILDKILAETNNLVNVLKSQQVPESTKRELQLDKDVQHKELVAAFLSIQGPTTSSASDEDESKEKKKGILAKIGSAIWKLVKILATWKLFIKPLLRLLKRFAKFAARMLLIFVSPAMLGVAAAVLIMTNWKAIKKNIKTVIKSLKTWVNKISNFLGLGDIFDLSEASEVSTYQEGVPMDAGEFEGVSTYQEGMPMDAGEFGSGIPAPTLEAFGGAGEDIIGDPTLDAFGGEGDEVYIYQDYLDKARQRMEEEGEEDSVIAQGSYEALMAKYGETGDYVGERKDGTAIYKLRESHFKARRDLNWDRLGLHEADRAAKERLKEKEIQESLDNIQYYNVDKDDRDDVRDEIEKTLRMSPDEIDTLTANAAAASRNREAYSDPSVLADAAPKEAYGGDPSVLADTAPKEAYGGDPSVLADAAPNNIANLKQQTTAPTDTGKPKMQAGPRGAGASQSGAQMIGYSPEDSAAMGPQKLIAKNKNKNTANMIEKPTVPADYVGASEKLEPKVVIETTQTNDSVHTTSASKTETFKQNPFRIQNNHSVASHSAK